MLLGFNGPALCRGRDESLVDRRHFRAGAGRKIGERRKQNWPGGRRRVLRLGLLASDLRRAPLILLAFRTQRFTANNAHAQIPRRARLRSPDGLRS